MPSEDLGRSTRRSFIKKSSAMGFLPVASLAANKKPTTKLPELRNQDGVVKWITVPKSWNRHRLKAERQVEKFRGKYRDKPGVVETGLVPSTETFGGKRGFEIEVGVDPARQKSEIPDSHNGIPVRTTERREPPADVCWNHDYDDNEIPGGVALYNASAEAGTSGWHIDYNGEAAILTDQHLVSQGDDVYGDDEGGSTAGKVGYCAGSTFSVDAAAVKSNSRFPEDTIFGQFNSWNQGGWVTEAGVSNRVSDPFDGYRMMGSTSGMTEGGLGKYHINDNYDSRIRGYDGHGVRGSANIAGGDSGGPAFSLHNDNAYLIYLGTQGDPKAGKKNNNSNCRDVNPFKKSIGTAAYHLNDLGYSTTGTSHS